MKFNLRNLFSGYNECSIFNVISYKSLFLATKPIQPCLVDLVLLKFFQSFDIIPSCPRHFSFPISLLILITPHQPSSDPFSANSTIQPPIWTKATEQTRKIAEISSINTALTSPAKCQDVSSWTESTQLCGFLVVTIKQALDHPNVGYTLHLARLH